jgi:hypothetical protein
MMTVPETPTAPEGTMIRSHADAARAFATARNKAAGKPLATSTRLHKRGEDFAVQYHDTDVVTFTAAGGTVLKTGGWLTQMTRSRIGDHLPTGSTLYSLAGRWYLSVDGVRYAFREGITVNADRTVTGYEPASIVMEQDKENRALNKKIKAYVAGLTPEIVATGYEQQGGDCFGCLAPAAFGVEHLALHVEESYYPLHLLATCLTTKGFRADVYLSMAARGDEWALRAIRKHLAGYMRNALYAGAVAVAHGRKPVGTVRTSWQQSA